MRSTSRLAVLALAATVVACHHGTAPVPTPAAPVAPATPPPAPPPAVSAQTQTVDDYARIRAMDLDAINRLDLLADVHFDFDKADIREADRQILTKDADVLRRFDFLVVTLEGHCDERGTVEYNLALGERRAQATRDYLTSLGVPAQRLKTISYGKENPVCQDHGEACWSQNRRAHPQVTGKS